MCGPESKSEFQCSRCIQLVATCAILSLVIASWEHLAAVEMFGRQLLARVALRLAEELQRPPRRFDQPGSITGSGRPQYDGYDGQI